ncbi:YncE family protein [Micromonospora sp. LOL_024]|uniref:YncE family protein n=1 Tax=Micromonospora sp. LOL_024 TaxID=3345412 RepID=UPI003A87F935
MEPPPARRCHRVMMAKTTISRRTLLTALAGAGAAALAGCDPAAPTPAALLPDPLLVEVDGGLGVLRGTERQAAPHGVATADGRLVYASAADGADTAVWRIDAGRGTASDRVRLPGRWVPQTVSADGTRLALTTEGVSATKQRPAGRDVTPVLIADAGGVRQRLQLPGNVVPEAFTADLAGLFVLEWLPPDAPDRYRVRVVDLATGVPGPLFIRDKAPVPSGAEEEMRGDGRQAVLAPDRTVLFTLYTHQPDHQHTRDRISGRPGSDVHAFVHTLHLHQRWAYCVDLPHPFGEGAADGHAMAITPDGGRLYVADLGSGAVAEISTEELTVRRTATFATGAGPAFAAADNERLFLGAGAAVRSVDLAGLTVAAHRPVGEPVTGLVLSGDGSRLYVGQRAAVAWQDPDSGGELGRAAVPGLRGLHGVSA